MLRRRSQLKERTKETPRRVFDKHRQFVRGFVCLLYGHPGHECNGKIEFAHVRKGTDGGRAQKPSDWWGNPLCEAAHEEQHTKLGEPSFEAKYGISLKRSALKLARLSPDAAMKETMREAEAQTPWMFEL